MFNGFTLILSSIVHVSYLFCFGICLNSIPHFLAHLPSFVETFPVCSNFDGHSIHVFYIFVSFKNWYRKLFHWAMHLTLIKISKWNIYCNIRLSNSFVYSFYGFSNSCLHAYLHIVTLHSFAFTAVMCCMLYAKCKVPNGSVSIVSYCHHGIVMMFYKYMYLNR